jgi:hypothetical protein
VRFVKQKHALRAEVPTRPTCHLSGKQADVAQIDFSACQTLLAAGISFNRDLHAPSVKALSRKLRFLHVCLPRSCDGTLFKTKKKYLERYL